MACRMSLPQKIIAVLGALAIGSFALALGMPVRAAPEARFATLQGESLATSDLRGTVSVITFWSTSCGVCVAEMPAMAREYRTLHARGYEMIAVAVKRDRADEVAAFAAAHALPFKVALDRDGEIARRFGNVHVTPTTFVLDRRGRVLRRFVGEPDWDRFRALVERALQAPAQ